MIEQSTTAEDLAGPIADSSKQLNLLRDYQFQLESIRGRVTSDIDSLIKINKELSQVQTQIESIAGTSAQLVQRVETETLTVSVTAVEGKSIWSPISGALSGFGASLSQGLSSAITGLAFLIPWALLLIAFTWTGRKLWRRWSRANYPQ